MADRNRPLGLWFSLLFVVAGAVALVVGATTGSLGGAVVGVVFVAVGGWMVVLDRRSHRHAVPSGVTVAALTRSGWQDNTAAVRENPAATLPRPVARHLRIGAAADPHVQQLAGIHPTGIHAAATRLDTRPEPVRVAETWIVTSTSSTNGRVTGGTVEPRVVAWIPLPADVGPVTIRPDNARMRLADLTGIRDDHTVDWDTVDQTWHLHGPDEPLLRAVVDIGLMGRLSELPGRWIVQFVDAHLLVIPTVPRNRLDAKPPPLVAVADEIGDVVVAIRSILPQMLWHDLDGFLMPYRR